MAEDQVLDDIPQELQVSTPRTPQDFPAWSMGSPRSMDSLPETPRHNQHTVDSVSKELNEKIAELATLAADLPRRLHNDYHKRFHHFEEPLKSHHTLSSNTVDNQMESAVVHAWTGEGSYKPLHSSGSSDNLRRPAVSIYSKASTVSEQKRTERSSDRTSMEHSSESASDRTSMSKDINPDSVRSLMKVRGSHINKQMKSMFFRRIDLYGHRELPLLLEALFSVVIICNAVFMGYGLHYHSEVGHALSWAPIAETTFCVAFFLELGIRIYMLQMQFVYGDMGMWNLFDFIVVFCILIDEVMRMIIELPWMDRSYLFGTLRMFRVAYTLKAIKKRNSSTVRQWRLLLLSVKAASRTVLCIAVLLFATVYMLAIVTTHGALNYCSNISNEHELLCLRFGTLWRSCASGYQALLGGVRWGTLVDALGELHSPHYAVIFVCVISYCVVVLMHVFTGIFVWIVRDVSDSEKTQWYMSDHLEERQSFMEQMRRLFKQVDLNSNGVLSKEELRVAFRDDKLSSFFVSMDLDIIAVENVFDLLDIDFSGFVSIDEFTFGCLRLRGKARAVDMERARRDLVAIRVTLDQIKAVVVQSSRNQQNPPPLRAEARRKSIEDENKIARYDHGVTHADLARQHLSSSGRSARKKRTMVDSVNRIEQPELRAMSLMELEDVVAIVRERCYSEAWIDNRTGELLDAAAVNLYHFTFHYLSPQTSPDYITLVGLAVRGYRAGDILTQVHSRRSGHIIGQAEVVDNHLGADLQVRLLKGHFESEDPPQDYRMLLDHNDQTIDCGSPKQVLNTDSISYKELVSPIPRKPQWFVCHWWGEPILDFVSCCREHSSRRRAETYWVCAYANRQHDLGSDIGDDPETSCFRKAMLHAVGLLLILDPFATPFSRIWCCFELYKTITHDRLLDIVALRNERHGPQLLTQMPIPGEETMEKLRREIAFPLNVLSKGVQLSLENGNASVQDDKVRILESMGKEPTGQFEKQMQQRNIDFANRRLRSYLAVAAWPQAIKKGCVLNFDRKASETVSLPEVLRQDSDRSALQISFGGIEEVTDGELELISQGLPPKLTALSLSFDGCTHVTDVGLKSLADCLSALPLQLLELDFASCKLLTDAGISHLSKCLPSTLVDVNVQLALIPNVSELGAKSLADHLPASVCRLQANFKGTQFNHQFDTVKQLKRMTR